MRSLHVLVLVLVLVLLATTATPAPAAPAARALVTYRQTGGFAGVDRSSTIYATGLVVSDGRRSRIGAAKLRTLRRVLDQARFPTLRRVYLPDTPLADGFTFRITYEGRTIRIEEGATIPPRLARVQSTLASLLLR